LTLLSLSLFERTAQAEDGAERYEKQQRVELTVEDLCDVSEVRHTRNISRSDIHPPFQGHQIYPEHFSTSGSFLLPFGMPSSEPVFNRVSTRLFINFLSRKADLRD